MDQKEAVLETLRKLHGLLSACNSEVTNQLGDCDLKVAQVHQIKIITDSKDLTFSGLAELLNITKPSVTEIVNKLIKMNCVKKIQSPKDGRIYFLETTDKGKAIATQDCLRDSIVADRILEVLDDTEIYIFIRAINKISC